MAQQEINGVRLYYEERGDGAPILCIHAAGSSALVWGEATEELARLGRVIAYDRRGCTRSERPVPYERTTVAEQADDAAALLDALGATPAVVIGRSYGGPVATDLALRHPDRVRALVLLEPDAPRGLAPQTAEWGNELADRLRRVAAQAGVDAVGEALISEVLGEGAWRSFPDEARRMFTQNGPAILAELNGEWWLQADAAERAEALADVLPNASHRDGRRRPSHRPDGAGAAGLHRGSAREPLTLGWTGLARRGETSRIGHAAT